MDGSVPLYDWMTKRAEVKRIKENFSAAVAAVGTAVTHAAMIDSTLQDNPSIYRDVPHRHGFVGHEAARTQNS